MRRLLLSGIVFVVIVGGSSAGWMALQSRGVAGGEFPEHVVALEEALALPGLLGLAAVDVGALAKLQPGSGGPPAASSAPTADPSWPERLKQAGFDWSSDVEHLLAAGYARGDSGFGFALAAFGSFRPGALEQFLRESPEFDVDSAVLHGRDVLQIMRRDLATCEESGPYLMLVESERIVIGDPDTLEAVLGSERSAAASRELGKFRSFRGSRLASFAVFLPDTLPGVSNPMVGVAAASAMSQLDGFRALYFGAGVQWMPPGLALASMLEAPDASVALASAAKWSQALDTSRTRLSQELPGLGALLDGLEIRTKGNELWLEARVDKELGGRLEQLPGELLAAAFGGGASAMLAAPGSAAPAEQLDTSPRHFEVTHAVESLPGYDASQSFAGEVEAESGPFGFRLHSLALPRDPRQGMELVVEALGTGLVNLGGDGERVQLSVTSVRALSGEELLATELCGLERNDLPVGLSNMAGADGPVSGVKRVRLVRGAQAADIAFVEGHVRLVYPSSTETLQLPPEAGALLERNGARLELGGVQGGNVAWEIGGSSERLLHLRALNASGAPLLEQSSMSMSSMFGAGGSRSGTTGFAGEVAVLEAVFAVEEESWEFPFALTRMRPGTSREQTGGEHRAFSNFPISRIRRDFAGATRDLAKSASAGAKAQATAGPFVVSLDSVWSFKGLMPQFEVRAPEIPNLEDNLGALELSLREIELKDGTVHRPGDHPQSWSKMVALGDAWSGEGLRANVSLETGAEAQSEEVSAISGALVLRMPRDVSAVSLPELSLGAELRAPGFAAVVSELGRDRFVLRAAKGGERVLSVRAYNERGQPLWMTGAEVSRSAAGWQGDFGVQGVPARIDVIVAGKLETAEFPFSMRLAAN